MILNLPKIGVIPKGEDSFLGIQDQVKPPIGKTLSELARVKDYDLYRQTILKGIAGDEGLTGATGLKGLTGDSAYTIEKDLLNVSSLSSYLNLFTKSYYTSLADKHLQCFTSYWDTRKTDYNSSINNQIELPFTTDGIYDAIVFWGDGTSDIVEPKPLIHSYEQPGIYKVIISGYVEGFSFRTARDQHKILLISDWGGLTIAENVGVFRNCSNLNIIANNKPTFKNVTSFREYFTNCVSLKTVPNIQAWPWVNVTDITSMFANCPNLVEDLSFIDVNDYELNINFGA